MRNCFRWWFQRLPFLGWYSFSEWNPETREIALIKSSYWHKFRMRHEVPVTQEGGCPPYTFVRVQSIHGAVEVGICLQPVFNPHPAPSPQKKQQEQYQLHRSHGNCEFLVDLFIIYQLSMQYLAIFLYMYNIVYICVCFFEMWAFAWDIPIPISLKSFRFALPQNFQLEKTYFPQNL